ncbi:MAG: HIT family protein [Alphaproteobacteria bacterium]|nr:HIT family protein [Alphaproteobacteria bacterium]
MSYDADNIFAKIIAGEFPAHKVYEDETAIAILDIMPQAAGHTLVIPKAPSRNLLDAKEDDLARLMPVVQKIARAAKDAFSADGIHIQQFNEAAAGQTVFHLHFHIIPRHEGVAIRPHSGEMENQDTLAAHSEKLKAAIAKV